eukprot:scaffold20005_cov55-Attheya_sp.AAC.6
MSRRYTLFGYTPEPAAVSLSNYCIYYGSMLEIQWDTDKKVPIRITGKYFWTAVKDYFVNFAVLNVLFSLLRPVAFAPFNTRSDAHSMDHTLWELLEPGGFQSLRVVDRPMLQSTSPSNFWGRRWNQLVHVVLKYSMMDHHFGPAHMSCLLLVRYYDIMCNYTARSI